MASLLCRAAAHTARNALESVISYCRYQRGGDEWWVVEMSVVVVGACVLARRGGELGC